jgi:hypothetical protein
MRCPNCGSENVYVCSVCTIKINDGYNYYRCRNCHMYGSYGPLAENCFRETKYELDPAVDYIKLRHKE